MKIDVRFNHSELSSLSLFPSLKDKDDQTDTKPRGLQMPRAALSKMAPEDDRHDANVACSIAELAASGHLRWTTSTPAVLFSDLVAIAEVNLPVARLYEGHINALRLIRTFGRPQLQWAVRQETDSGMLLGVWGAEGETPLSVEDGLLVGGKRFASGLGTVGKAVVTVGQGNTTRLALLDVSDSNRQRLATWRKSGMRATVSGDFDAAGLPASALDWIGSPGQYLQEPGFVGGVWRIAAVQVGGTLGLLRAAADYLDGLGRLTTEAQVARLSPILTRALAAAEFTRRAALCAEGPEGRHAPEKAASFSAQARLLTEDVGQDAIAAVERSVGLLHFDEDAATGRIARDLATYMRQSARDALVQRSGTWALSQTGPYSRLLEKEPSDALG